MALPISIACGRYDRTLALQDGRVAVEGCAPTLLFLPPEETFYRAFLHTDFDVAELSLSSYVLQHARGDTKYIAVPIFLSRVFRHSAIYIRTDRGIEKPADLKGRVIGVPEYQMTAAVWVRGLLEDEYGVRPEDIRWRSGGLEQPGRHEKITLSVKEGVEIRPIGPEDTLSDLLERGEIDGLVTARSPSCFQRGAPDVGRLFPDYRSVEQDYYRRTGIFPIMHLLGVRKALAEQHPWIIGSVVKAFVQAKQAAMEAVGDHAALTVTLPWVAAEQEETRRLMGADYWPYGLERNRATLETLIRYQTAQGMLRQPVDVASLFAPSSLSAFVI